MSKLSELIGKPTKITLGSIELDIKPLSMDDMNLFKGGDNEEENIASAQAVVKKVLQDSVPDATEEELKNISLEYMTELMDHIMTINKMKGKPKFPIQNAGKVKE